MHSDDITISHLTAGDFDDTEFRYEGGPFATLDAEHPIAQAFHAKTGLTCALARAPEQTENWCDLEARYKIAKYVAEHRCAH